MMLPSDIVLVQDKKFKKYVQMYAKDQVRIGLGVSILGQDLDAREGSGAHADAHTMHAHAPRNAHHRMWPRESRRKLI